MNLLALDTSTERVFAAVQRGSRVWERSAEGAAQASAGLIPLLQALMADAGLSFGALDAIAFGCGPGSFTGLRTACAVAQGLGFGAGVRLLPVPTLLAVAEDARERSGARRVVAALDARMGELYVASYDFDSTSAPFHADARLVSPEDLEIPPGWVLAGNTQAAYGDRLAWRGPVCSATPSAAAMLRLCPALMAAGQLVDAEHALPLYIRDKVAKTTQERESDKRAAISQLPP